MKHILLLALLVIIHTTSFAQQKTTDELTVDGTSAMKVYPDLAVIRFTIDKTDTIQSSVLQSLNQALSRLVSVIKAVGIIDSAIKISNYELSSSFDDDDRKTYSAEGRLKLTLKLDTKLLDALYRSVQEANMQDLDIDFDTKISESLSRSTKSLLVQSAIEDAKRNATDLANSLKVKLIRIKEVNMSSGYDDDLILRTGTWKTGDFYLRQTQIAFKTPFADFRVEEKEMEETVTLVYQIAN